MISSCGQYEETAMTQVTDSPRTFLSGQFQQINMLPSGGSISSLAVGSDGVLVAGAHENSSLLFWFGYSVGDEGLVCSSPVELWRSEDTSILDLAATEEGFLAFSTCAVADDPTRTEYSVSVLDEEGQERRQFLLELRDGETPEEICALERGFLLWSEDFLSVFDKDGKRIAGNLLESEQLWTVYTCKLGAVARARSIDGNTVNFRRIDTSQARLAEESIGLNGILAYVRTWDAGDLLLLDDGSTLQSWDFDSGEVKDVLSWYDIMGRPSPYDWLFRVTEHDFFLACSGQNIVTALHTTEEADTRIPLTVAFIGNAANFGRSDILAQFNTAQTEYRAQARIYEYSSAGYQQLNLDISVGDAPDIVMFDTGVFTDSGFFVDLFPLLFTDTGLAENDFVPGLIQGLKQSGTLRELWYRFQLNVWVSNKSVTDGATDWKYDDYAAKLEELTQGDQWAVLPKYKPSDALASALSTDMSDYIDVPGRSCQLKDERFLKLLNYIRENSFEPDVSDDIIGEYRAETNFLLQPTTLVSISQIRALSGRFGQDYLFVNSPWSEHASCYEAPYTGARVAVPTRAQCLDGAVCFVHLLMTEEIQLSLARDNAFGLPVNLQALRRLAAELSEEDRLKLLALVAETDQVFTGKLEKIETLIQEQLAPVFHGEKDLEAAVGILQSKISLALNE